MSTTSSLEDIKAKFRLKILLLHIEIIVCYFFFSAFISLLTSFMNQSTDFPKVEGNEAAGVFSILQNEIYGRYIVASQQILKGELVLEELPLLAVPCGKAVPCAANGPPGPLSENKENYFPFCLTCGKHVNVKECCSRCKWPICNNHGVCENDPAHADGECGIFNANQVLPESLTLSEYDVIGVLRILFLRSRDPSKWKQILQFESHAEIRRLIPMACQAFVTDFIQRRCNLIEFETEIIEQVMGILSVNSFWAYPYISRCMSRLFDKGTIFSNDCDPNTREEIFELEQGNTGATQTQNKIIGLRLFATRTIQSGDIITLAYIYPSQIQASVDERQKYLQTYYHFTCNCNRCTSELKIQKGRSKAEGDL